MPTQIACCRTHPKELVIHPTPGDSPHNIWGHLELGGRLPGHCRGTPGPQKRWTPVLFPNPTCCLLLPLLMQWPNFHQASLCVWSYQKGSFMRAGIVLKRRFFQQEMLDVTWKALFICFAETGSEDIDILPNGLAFISSVSPHGTSPYWGLPASLPAEARSQRSRRGSFLQVWLAPKEQPSLVLA